MKLFKKLLSFVLCAIMVLSIVPIYNIEAEAAATYPKIEALKVPRIYQPSSDTIGMCHFNSIACLIAYKKGSYTYGNLSRTYSYGTDYAYSSDPIWKKMYNDCNECYDPILNNYYTKYPGNIVTEEVTGNNTQTYKIIYEQLSKGNPVVVYGTGSPNHASVVIGYSADTNSLDASKFSVMQITKSGNYWPNSKSNFDAYANSPTTNHSKSCYLTLSAWLSYNKITLTRITYYKDPGVEIDKSYKEYSVSKTNAVLCGKVFNPKLKTLGNCGIKLYDSSGNLLKECQESISSLSSYSAINLYYNVNKELKYTLKEGTTYKYQLSAVVNGKKYYSDMETFTTTGTASAYTLTYNANGGSGAPSSQSGATSYSVSSTKPTKSGYTFLGWSTSSNATSASYAGGDTISLSANTTLYAVWKEIPVYNAYELVYDANGGSGAPESLMFSENETIYISEEIPTRFGYIFEGWVSEDGFWYYPGQEAMFFEATVLYASWGNQKLSADESIVLEITDECREVFVEFSPEESGVYAFKSFDTQDELDTIGALYDINGTELVSDDDSGDGNNFMFYYTVYAGETYYIKVSAFNSAKGTSGFEIVPAYYVTYNANGGQIILGGSGIEEVLDTSTTVPYIEVVRDGYTFVGWSEDRIAQYATYTEGNELYLDGNTTLYAVWEKNDLPADPEPDDDLVLSGFLTIRTPSVTKINYGDSIVLHADLGNVPITGLKVTWEANNDNFEIVSVSEDGRECVITPKKSGDTTFTATVKIGTLAFSTDTQVMTSKAGFFQKIIAFFKNLFGLAKTIPEAFKYAY